MDQQYKKEREDWINIGINKGYSCNPETGEVYGIRGNLLTAELEGYKMMRIKNNGENRAVFQHQFIWYYVNREVVDCLDHINGDKKDNRITNLRSVTQQQNNFNRKAKGYHFSKRLNKWHSQINFNGDKIYLGLFNTKDEAHQAYLNAKKLYHKI